MITSRIGRIDAKLILMGIILCLFFAGAGNATEVTIKKPTVGGYRLDYCREWAKNCGKPAADRFCQTIGHATSIRYRKATDIGDKTPTRVISSNQVCSGKSCDGFDYVRCKLRSASLDHPNKYIPKKQKKPDPIYEDPGKADSMVSHSSAGVNVRNYNSLADGAIRAIANRTSGVSTSSLIRSIEDSCASPSAACHLEMKLKFLEAYLNQ